MTYPGPTTTNSLTLPPPSPGGDPSLPLSNLAAVRTRLDSLSRFLSASVNANTLLPEHQMAAISSELSSAIHHVIINAASLLTSQTRQPDPPTRPGPVEVEGDQEDEKECEIVELDAVNLLAEHVHVCEICGKGFKRDANLRMHMRAHGNQYKTTKALAKPESNTKEVDINNKDIVGRKTRFSCPYVGCNRNQTSKNFRPLKSVICVKNHFKRSHCAKMYSCNRCNKKSFSVLADLRSHLKHCGESKWKCTCGTSFSRKDKLFGHMALFEGHMPAVAAAPVEIEDDETESVSTAAVAAGEAGSSGFGCGLENVVFDELVEGFGSVDDKCLEDMLMESNFVGDLFNF